MGHVQRLLVVLALAHLGCRGLLGVEDPVIADAALDAPADASFETGRILPLLCTGGQPADPTCPINHLPLDSLGVTGSLDFVVQALGSGVYFTQLQFTAGSDGLYLEHPLLLFWPSGLNDPVPDSIDRFFDVTLNIPPGKTELLGSGTAAFVGVGLDPVSIRFATVGPFRP